jgi:acyl phosphate:glycerol-3-phosphate acyltransferase
MIIIETAVFIIAAYLLGAVPSGFLITKAARGVDIREHGSENPGATNVYRVAGPFLGIVTFTADFLKGFAPVLLAVKFFGAGYELCWVLTGLAALAGNVWTVFLSFKGGKGVTTAAGVFFALMPLPAAAAFIIFWIVFLPTRYVSAGSLIAAAALPAASFLLKEPLPLSIFASCAALLIIIRHRSNIKRLLSGTENKMGAKNA